METSPRPGTVMKASEVRPGDVILSGQKRYNVTAVGGRMSFAREDSTPELGGPMFVMDTDIKPLCTFPDSEWRVIR